MAVEATMLYGDLPPINPEDIARVRALLAGHEHETEILESLGITE